MSPDSFIKKNLKNCYRFNSHSLKVIIQIINFYNKITNLILKKNFKTGFDFKKNHLDYFTRVLVKEL